MNKILVENGDKKELRRIFGVSYPTIRKALNGNSKSLLSVKIRKAAIERGGMEVELVKERRE